ncbi:T7-like head-to-tail connector [uncultured phage_MedDCM-OCT-S45-C4]|uniref:T7-like head-to-tail connector n=1 Tax=uncultured phage_MedDCM-OCT-S45-C4 TaxID=2740801 RepID=A0A6S4PFS0_9CAUD|nr:T7-like head-to-tail connector [uncultured phage_MedDCM-OCT-S45-C4]BAQ93983.1 T7-like head-to-tail connector [uncultured phage_MedDCM-OCT-S45-C4]
MNARSRYDHLTSGRNHFLDIAVECSELTLPYLIQRDELRSSHKTLRQPWQSVGSKAVVTLASKLMLALLPPQTSFFKLQIRDDKLGTELPAEIRSELDLSFAKMERMVMDSIASSSDRVAVHQAIKHLVVGGNALMFMGKEGIKHYPLNRYVLERDGNGNVIEIVTKELINKQLLPKEFQELKQQQNVNTSYGSNSDDVEIYTHVKLDNNRWVWHQEAFDKVIPNTDGKSPKDANPWLVLRFNSVDGENYGRGRVEEFLGDLKSLNALSQAMVEGSASAAKVVFVVSPSSTTKPQTIAQAGNGAIVQGRPEDIGVIQVGKTADFSTALQMMQTLERRILEAFLVLTVRQSERTTAEEVRLTQLELEQQLGGLFSLLTVEFLVPYLNRKLLVLSRSGQLPKYPKDLVAPTIIAGINALGRGQDRESLTAFIQTIAQTLGPQALMTFINADEAIKRLAAAQGIDVLNLVKSVDDRQAESDAAAQQEQEMAALQQAPQLLKSPMMDPSKNPNAEAMLAEAISPE